MNNDYRILRNLLEKYLNLSLDENEISLDETNETNILLKEILAERLRLGSDATVDYSSEEAIEIACEYEDKDDFTYLMAHVRRIFSYHAEVQETRIHDLWVRKIKIKKALALQLLQENLSFINRIFDYGGDPVLSVGEDTAVIKFRKPGHDYHQSLRFLSRVVFRNVNIRHCTDFSLIERRYYVSMITIDINRAEFISSLTDYFMKCP